MLLFRGLTITAVFVAAACGASVEEQPGRAVVPRTYVLGPGDQLNIWALGLDETLTKAVNINPSGTIDLPLVGRVLAAGLTIDQLREAIITQCKRYINEPQVSVSITEFRSQPVSILGAVKDPGVRQLQGGKRLLEVLSLAGGMTPDAGPHIVITRRKVWGGIPLPSAKPDETGEYTTANVSVEGIVSGKTPEQNVVIMPEDVISVPRAQLVYVMGEVNKPGGFVLNEKESLSVLQALSLAGGITKVAASGKGRILRNVDGSTSREEIRCNLGKVLGGKAKDFQLQPNDILFVPNSTAKSFSARAIETGIQLGTGVIIWRR
jgi:polysaccharide export outer membrane protein